jgi:hypothetical protein
MMHLCKYMPEEKDSRRKIPDPANEPDFGTISRLYPLPQQDTITSMISKSTLLPSTSYNTDLLPSTTLPVSTATHATGSSMLTAQPAVSTIYTPQGQPHSFDVLCSADGSTNLNVQLPDIATVNATLTKQQPQPKVGMDRDAALAEIKSLRARLASEGSSRYEAGSAPDNNDTTVPPLLSNKRKVLASSSLADETTSPMNQLARMPQPFPTRAKKSGLSQMETILQRNAIVAAMRKQKEQEEQHQQQQLEEKMQQQRNLQLQELQDQQRLIFLQQQQFVSQQQHAATVSNFHLPHQQQLQLNAEIFANQMSDANNLHHIKQLYQQQQQRQQQQTSLSALQQELQLSQVAQQQQILGLRNHFALQTNFQTHHPIQLQQQQQQIQLLPSIGGLSTNDATAATATSLNAVGEYLRGATGNQHYS